MYVSVCSGSQYERCFFFTMGYVREVSEMLLEKIVSLYSGFLGSISSLGILKSRRDWER